LPVWFTGAESVEADDAPEESASPDFFFVCLFPCFFDFASIAGSELAPDVPLEYASLLPEVDGEVAGGELGLLLSIAAPGALWEWGDGTGEVMVPPLDCANASDETDAMVMNESDRTVDFNVICNSLILRKRHHRCLRFGCVAP
jgi:hypothetical protein